MNPEIQKELLSWLQALKSTVESGVAVAKVQIPQILWEKILLDRVAYTFSIVVGLVLLFGGLYFGLKVLPKWWNDVNHTNRNDQDALIFRAVVMTILAAIGTIAGFIVFINTYYDFFTVWFAPRIYLLNWVKEMVK